MEPQQLQDLLRQLHSELGTVKSVDDATRELLQNLQTDIEDVMDRSLSSQEQRYPKLSQRLQNTLVELESQHPTTTSVIGQIAHILSQMGI